MTCHLTKTTLIIALLACVVGQSSAQTDSRDTDHLPPIEMSQNPLKMPGLGIEIRLPVGSTSTKQSFSREVNADIIGKDDGWRLTISTRSSSDTSLDSESAATQILGNLQISFGITDSDDSSSTIGTFARVLDAVKEIEFHGGTAHRFYLLQPAAEEGLPNTIRGVAVIKIGEGEMLVWDMTAPEANYAIAKQAMDATLSAVATTANPLTAVDREVALKTGHGLIRGIEPDRMREVFENYGKRWYRLYNTNAADDKTEIGYRRIHAWAGTRADLGGNQDPTPGYLVQIEARTLDQNSTGINRLVYDSKGTYFVSEDFKQEAWHLVVVVKQQEKSTKYTEIGARNGFEELVVTTTDPTGTTETIQLQIKEEGYLPLPTALILPTLLAETKATGDVAFYTYRSDTSTVTFRQDSIRHDAANTNHWIHRSSVSRDTPQIIKHLDEAGMILYEDLPGERRWEQTDINELFRIWRANGLPLD